MRFLRTNTAVRLTVGPFFDATDGITPEVALTATNEKLTLMVDDGNVPTLVLDTTATASGGSNDMVHVTGDDAGFYDLELAAANVNYLGRAMLAITYATDHCPVFHEFMILPAMVYDSMVLGTDVLQADVTQWLGTAAATPTVAGVPEVDITHIGGTAATSASGIPEVKVASVAANALSASSLATDAVTEIRDGVFTGQMTESYNTDGTAPTFAQAIFLILQMLTEKSISGTTLTVKKLDGSTSAATFTLDSATTPTSITRAS